MQPTPHESFRVPQMRDLGGSAGPAGAPQSVEQARLADAYGGKAPFLFWGPYLSERQWGTVREDYSSEGKAWDYFPHDHARSRAYRWGEDGLLGISDEKQRLCFALALWNGQDPILKERAFGLTNTEGNHGEDVKEYYFYLDGTPTYSYLKGLYKYPHRAYPYDELVSVNAQRKQDLRNPEYELLDTGVFAEGRYFDVQIEYAKASPTDVLIRISVTNRGPEEQILHLLPTLWFRNNWSWKPNVVRPVLRADDSAEPGLVRVHAHHPSLGDYWLYCERPDELLFVENETNSARVFKNATGTPFPKDGINDYLVGGVKTAVNPARIGTKAAAHYRLTVGPGATSVVRLRLADVPDIDHAFADFDGLFAQRLREADAFYEALAAPGMSAEHQLIQRQALAGTLWTKQFYHFIVEIWLHGDPNQPPPPRERLTGRNSKWIHFYADDVLTPPDTWEYPWGFAAWDLAFQSITLALVDPENAKQQLYLVSREWYMSPEGQVPAYEWGFGDVNPPVHAWAAWHVYQIDKKARGHGDTRFLRRLFHRCTLFLSWWVNRKDALGNNLFQGGFLGMDNIGAFDRNAVPPGCMLFQCDSTSWMGQFLLQMIQIALELAKEDASWYLELAAKYFQHFLYVADAMKNVGKLSEGTVQLWDEARGFYYDVLRTPDGQFVSLKAETMIGLLPLLPVLTVDPFHLTRLATGGYGPFQDRIKWLVREQAHRVLPVLSLKSRLYKRLKDEIQPRVREQPDHVSAQAVLPNEAQILELLFDKFLEQGSASEQDAPVARGPGDDPFLLSFVDEDRLRNILTRLLDEEQFLGPHGIRSVSRYHRDHPYSVTINGQEFRLDYEPAESTSGTFGGNSNWRGPVWFPVNYSLLVALEEFHRYYGDSFRIECPTGSGQEMNLAEVAREIRRRLISTFERDGSGRRPVYGQSETFQEDPHWRDYLLFFEYFNGDNGTGLGASHQTGWTGLVANLIQQQTENAARAAGEGH